MTTTLHPSVLPGVSTANRPTGNLSLAELSMLVRSVAARTNLWQTRLRIPDEHEERWWMRLRADSRVDLWLLAWRPGHETDLHDHGTSAAAFSVVQGCLAETRAYVGQPRTSHVHPAGSIGWVAPGVIHEIRGAGDGPAVSIHAYSPPLQRMNFYADSGGDLEVVRSVATTEPDESRR